MQVLTPEQRTQFEHEGFVRVCGAFASEAAAAMRDVIWEELRERYGVDRDDRSTWTVEFPAHLQGLKRRPEFRAISSSRTIGAIDDLLGEGNWDHPRHWGAFFIVFPKETRSWTVPSEGWHVDAEYTAPPEPLFGLKVFALLGDVAPRAGGTMLVVGMHRVIPSFVAKQPPEIVGKLPRARKALMRSHPWLVELSKPGDGSERVERFMLREGEIGGVPVRVVEVTGNAGDVVLVHPWLLHVRPVNAGSDPRFVLAKDLPRNGGHMHRYAVR